jgi:hypothetical protein
MLRCSPINPPLTAFVADDMQADQGLLLHPTLGTVTYLSAPAAAAPTIVLDRPSPLLADESPSGPVTAATACWPHAGRHLAFDGKLLHGALPDLTPTRAAEAAGEASTAETTGAPPPPPSAKPSAVGRGKKSATKPGGEPAVLRRRVTFLVNVWLNHAPWGAEELPKKVRARLGQSAGAKIGLDRSRRVDCDRVGVGDDGGSGTAAAAERASLKARAGARPEATRPLSWTFGEAKARLELKLPWPEKAVTTAFADAVRSGRAGPPVLALSFASSAGAALNEAPQASRKRKKA